MIKSVIFDFDGVIAESVDIKTEAFRELFQDYPGLVERIVRFHRQNGGMSRYDKFRYFYKEIIKKPLPEEKFRELCGRFRKLVTDKVVASEDVAGAREFLEENYRKYQLFVASGTPSEEIREIVRRKNLQKYFRGVFGSPSGKREIISDILKDNSLLERETVFIGDSVNDLEGARACGVYFIARVTERDFAWLKDSYVRGALPDLRGLSAILDQWDS